MRLMWEIYIFVQENYTDIDFMKLKFARLNLCNIQYVL
jgi:hypothetical protein